MGSVNRHGEFVFDKGDTGLVEKIAIIKEIQQTIIRYGDSRIAAERAMSESNKLMREISNLLGGILERPSSMSGSK